MSVAVLVQHRDSAPALVRWGMRLARARRSKLQVWLVVNAANGGATQWSQRPFVAPEGEENADPLLVAVRAIVGEAEGAPRTGDAPDPSRVPVLRELRASDVVSAVAQAVSEHGIGLLLAAKRDPAHGGELGDAILADAPCDVMLLRATAEGGRGNGRILVPAAGGPHAAVALRVASDLARSEGSEATALYVKSLGGEEPQAEGEFHLKRVLQQSGIAADAPVASRVELSNRPRDTIRSVANEDFELVVVGASDHAFISRTLFGTIDAHLMARPGGASVAVVRRGRPIHKRVLRSLEQRFTGLIPQLQREQRVELAERLLSGSICNFDFLAMMVLSTAIAAFGLLLSSTAVVVGAMLVAPLMTPIMGAGLALVQGNAVLMKQAARSIFYGFCCALAIGVVLGFITPIDVPTSELLARGAPNLLDLGVALVSGIAGAYAMARPNLSAALPGVAIAAALVPPIATVGIALALGEFAVARGAVMLFGTNVVAIILSAAAVLYAVGLRSGGSPQVWVLRLLQCLLLAVVVLAVPLTAVLVAQVAHAPQEAEHGLHHDLELAVAELPLGELGDVTITDLTDHQLVHVVVRSAEPLPANYAQQLLPVIDPHIDGAFELRLEGRVVQRVMDQD